MTSRRPLSDDILKQKCYGCWLSHAADVKQIHEYNSFCIVYHSYRPNSMVSFDTLLGIYDVSTRCTQYPDYCVSGSPLLYAKTLLQCQEANFIIGTSVCLIYVGILSRYLTTLTSNLTTVNGGGLQSEEDKVIYSQLSNQ